MNNLINRSVSQISDSSPLASMIRTFFTDIVTDTGRSVGVTACLALLGVCLLIGAYSLIKTDWPEAYTDVETRTQEHIRVNPIRTYVIFRGSPVFLVCGFVAVLTDRAEGWAWWGFLLMMVIYLSFTTGRAVIDVLRRPRHPNWVMLMLYHALSVVVVLFSGIFALSLRSLFAPIIPSGRELLISLWAGIFAALLAAVARHMLAPVRLEGPEVIDTLIRDIGSKNWAYLSEKTMHDEGLRTLAMAVVLAEVQQRPRWFRMLERLGGKIYGPGTYGVAQIASDIPLTDQQSIDHLVARLDVYPVYEALEQGHYSEEFEAVCLSLNDDYAHVHRISSFYRTINEMRNSGTLLFETC